MQHNLRKAVLLLALLMGCSDHTIPVEDPIENDAAHNNAGYSSSSSSQRSVPSSSATQILANRQFTNISGNEWKVYKADSLAGTIELVTGTTGNFARITPRVTKAAGDLQLIQAGIHLKKGYRYWFSISGKTTESLSTRSISFGLQNNSMAPYYWEALTITESLNSYTKAWEFHNCDFVDTAAEFFINGGGSPVSFQIHSVDLLEELAPCSSNN